MMSSAQAAQQFIAKRYHDTYAFISPTTHGATGQRVLITGSSKGIGLATALSFARAGASHIGIHSRSAASLEGVEQAVLEAARAAGRSPAPRVVKLVGDLSSEADVAAFSPLVRDGFDGRLDVVISNAGHLETWAAIGDADLDTWWRTWEVNIKGMFLVARALVPFLLQPRGTFVQITSGGALATIPGASGYQTTKTAQIRLAGFLQAEYADKGLLAYSVHPGSVLTDLGSGMPEEAKAMIYKEPDQPGLAGDVLAWAVRERREWLAGRYVDVRWDMEQLLARKDEIVEKDLLKLKLTLS